MDGHREELLRELRSRGIPLTLVWWRYQRAECPTGTPGRAGANSARDALLSLTAAEFARAVELTGVRLSGLGQARLELIGGRRRTPARPPRRPRERPRTAA